MFAAFLILALQATPLPSPAASPVPSPAVTAAPSPAVTGAPSPSPTPPNALALQPAAVNLHPNQSAPVGIAGGTAPFTVAVDTPLVSAAIDQEAHTLSVVASANTGRAVVTLTDAAGNSAQLPVRVAYDAAVVPPNVTLRVTGDALQTQWLQGQVLKALAKAVQVQPGTTARYGAFALPSVIGPGASADIPVAVAVTGGETYFDVNATTTVTLQNVAAPSFLPPLLFYDDDPERVVAEGVLYRNRVTPQNPARLYYYHQNMQQPHRIVVVFAPAQSGDPSTVQLIDASAGPNIDVMTVGHAVSRDFLVDKAHNNGTIVDVGAAPYVADAFLAQPGDGVAGSIGINVLSGGPVDVAVLSIPATVTDDQIAQYLNAPKLPGDGHRRTGTFSLSNYGQERLPFSVGGDDAYTQYGATTPPSTDNAGRDVGDYGVIHTLTFDVTNPGSAPATVYLYEEPLGGVVRSSFLVNGVLNEVGCARVSQKYQIGQPLSVDPGRSEIVVQTMTDGGSNYPLGVGMSSTPPLPQTPPISAPDGCFPKPQPSPPAETSPETPPSPIPAQSPAVTASPSP